MNRVLNFSAGPSALPLSVLERARDEFISYKGMGFSIMEVSHRGKVFDELHNNAIAKVKKFYGLNDDYAVLFLQGGATLQFAQVPMNLYNGGVAQYVNTGVWTTKAIKEAKIQNINYEVVASSEDTKFDRIPQNIKFSDNADYGYICSNNTIYGTQYEEIPTTKCPLVVDSSSDLLSREIDFNSKNIGMFYGGAQKNAGPAGITIVIIRKDLASRVKDSIPTPLRYTTQIEANSLANTPCTFGIYMFDLVLDWIKDQGGLNAINAANKKKASTLYGFIDNSDFYKAHAKQGSRSLMNVSFTTPSTELDAKFVKEAEQNSMIGLKGHRLLGGLRASIYNAVSQKEVETLIEFMKEFQRVNG
ncbi:phosphoserine aminotransferase [Campylobacter hyointestinalis]|uniref:3-phosphoserine/phosphohydroxythreonine transaminase n=1 Tax=Campylobacter hyointestinalis TaxID=198 RepID=UPI00072612E2|nr:3-phosphoserine/phosphohydroxythreonine transaminase [Campylobacter hyointestinalis]PPB55490.1 phosphoserine transaminase [Campylobacter hyointestinalis subsp. hyointestinalis]CUU82859.1 phosphoserine aminotransferase [Campylobacter hyointestinalis]